jgi:hypothetical protein
MLRSTNLLSSSELFEELNDQVSEKISGGFTVELTATFATFRELSQLLEPDLLTEIESEIARRFSKVGTDLALGCTSTELGVYNCTVSTGGRTETFAVDVR